MVKPIRILLFLFYIGCISSVIMVVSPGEITVADSLSFDVFTFDAVYQPPDASEQPADITDIVANTQANVENFENQADTNVISSPNAAPDTTKIKTFEPSAEPRQLIEYPDSTRFVLDDFFNSLQNLSENQQLIRVVHYGDSQLEGDRITQYLRTRLQKQFGGCGVGLVPLLEKQAIRSTLHTYHSPNMKKYGLMDNSKSSKRTYGLLGGIFTFTPANLSKDSEQEYATYTRFRKSKYDAKTDTHTKIENVKILYRANRNLYADVLLEEDSSFKDIFAPNENFAVAKMDLNADFEKLTINFKTKSDTELYGVALDCHQGIAVDNVALRGCAVVDFRRTSGAFLRSQLEKMNVKLLVLQFGVNVVPNPVKNYNFYETMFYNQLKYVKALMPELSILVVGVSDMSCRRGGQYVSYPNVTLIRDAQKRAAFRAGCAFWDLYLAMGGENSMPAWVSAKPSLANKDYTHFNHRGAKLVGEMLYNALAKEYENYALRQNQE